MGRTYQQMIYSLDNGIYASAIRANDQTPFARGAANKELVSLADTADEKRRISSLRLLSLQFQDYPKLATPENIEKIATQALNGTPALKEAAVATFAVAVGAKDNEVALLKKIDEPKTTIAFREAALDAFGLVLKARDKTEEIGIIEVRLAARQARSPSVSGFYPKPL